jgi:hypothetical protein
MITEVEITVTKLRTIGNFTWLNVVDRVISLNLSSTEETKSIKMLYDNKKDLQTEPALL